MASMPSFHNSMFKNHGVASGFNEFSQRSAGVHLKKALEVSANVLFRFDS